MYGLAVYRSGKIYAAVSPSKRALKAWMQGLPDASALECGWRMRDESGWCDGSDWLIERFPAEAVVLWGDRK